MNSENIVQIIGNYKIYNTKIGQGKHGICYLATYIEKKSKKSPIKCAVKILKPKNSIDMESFEKNLKREIFNMKKCKSCENIVRIIDCEEQEDSHYIFLEYCDQKLTDLIEMREKIKTKVLEDIIYEILNGIKFMHDNGIIHRDIKPDNILLKNGKIKICDLGLSRIEAEEMTKVGTVKYYPLDLKSGKYNYKCDIFGIGVIIYQLIFKTHPFQGLIITTNDYFNILYEYLKGEKEIKFGDKIDKNLKNFIMGLISIESKERFNWAQIFLSTYVVKIKKKRFIEKIEKYCCFELQICEFYSKLAEMIVNCENYRINHEIRLFFIKLFYKICKNLKIYFSDKNKFENTVYDFKDFKKKLKIIENYEFFKNIYGEKDKNKLCVINVKKINDNINFILEKNKNFIFGLTKENLIIMKMLQIGRNPYENKKFIKNGVSNYIIKLNEMDDKDIIHDIYENNMRNNIKILIEHY